MATSALSPFVSQSAAAQLLQDALHEFRNALDEKQRRDLDDLEPVPNAHDIFVFTARLDRRDPNRKGRSFSSRLITVLLAVRDFCDIADTFVSAHPEIAALVWGSVKLTMKVISNFASYYEVMSDLFMRIGRLCPLFDEYLILYQTSARLRKSVIEFHTSIVRCCKHVVEAVQRPLGKQLLQALWNCFEQEFEPDFKSIQSCSAYVKEEIALAQAQVNAQEQQLQVKERENASRSRSAAMKFFARAETITKQRHEQEMQKGAQKIKKQKKKLLDKLSTYDHVRPLKQSRSKRYNNTLDWISQTAGFRRWVDGGVPLLCCFGKIGAGKTIAASSVIDHILSEQGSDCHLSFFFAETGNRESLSAETILRSILRQRLDSVESPQEVVDGLEKLDACPELDDLAELLRTILPPSRVSYIIIDGLDECEKADRNKLLITLASLIVPGSNTRLLLLSRDSVREEIKTRFTVFESFTMGCPAALHGISRFIEDMLEEKLESGELTLTDNSLKKDIKQALSDGAQGMFLWVTFQMDEICSQHCDEDIRAVLKDLPKSLTEVYCRVLRRIQSRGHQKEAQKFFPWIAASKQFLSLSQLREATAIEIGQQYSKPERLFHKMENITSWCENLVRVDEEYQLVQFAHSTIAKFLTEESRDSTLAGFHVNVDEADHKIGEICVTYLDFNDFKTTVARRQKPMLVPDPVQITQSVLGIHSKTALILAKLRAKSVSTPVDISSLRSLENSPVTHAVLVEGHPFLEYATNNWLLHTKNFRPETAKTWKLWENMVLKGHELTQLPGGETDLNINSRDTILAWACNVHHYALLRLAISLNLDLTDVNLDYISAFCVRNHNNADVIETFSRGKYEGLIVQKMLQISAEGYHPIPFVEKLIAINAKATREYCHIALRSATTLDHLKALQIPHILEKLIAAGADTNTCISGAEWTLLQTAVRYGHVEIVNSLLAAGADVNAPAATTGYGLTALQAAIKRGNFEIINSLLAAGADVNAPAATSGYRLTALQAAAVFGSVEIVECLLAAGADFAATNEPGDTALRLASIHGHSEVVKTLLTAGADKNASRREGKRGLLRSIRGD